MPDNSQIHTALVKELTDVLVRFHEQHPDLYAAHINPHSIMDAHGRQTLTSVCVVLCVQPEGKKPNA
jgi:single-stranded DNA-specific DHH superfamily exonuclease